MLASGPGSLLWPPLRRRPDCRCCGVGRLNSACLHGEDGQQVWLDGLQVVTLIKTLSTTTTVCVGFWFLGEFLKKK